MMLLGPVTPRSSPIVMLQCDFSGDSILLGKMWCATVKRASPNGQEGNSTLCKRGITLPGQCNRPQDIGWRDTVLSSPTCPRSSDSAGARVRLRPAPPLHLTGICTRK